MPTWRPTTPSDIPHVLRVADLSHPTLPESASVFAERACLFPAGSLVLASDSDPTKIHGYAVSHPIRHGEPPALDSLLGEIAADADAYYIHDVAVLPEMRGRGYAAEAVERLLKVAGEKGFSTTCLVSVYGTGRFWERFGFDRLDVDEEVQGKVGGYGDDAVYMVRRNF
ncbi:acyl-CoA N-acyltransferase [Podospora conica]|nr:acyl-CoA N-acyltransferase [Schizothecium conicum]